MQTLLGPTYGPPPHTLVLLPEGDERERNGAGYLAYATPSKVDPIDRPDKAERRRQNLRDIVFDLSIVLILMLKCEVHSVSHVESGHRPCEVASGW